MRPDLLALANTNGLGVPSAPWPLGRLQHYAALAEAEAGVSFVGRLAQYRDDDIDQAVVASLKLGDELRARAAPN